MSEKAIFIIPMCTGSLSVIGSLSIVYSIISDFKKKLEKPKFRILLGICIFDIIGSVSFIFSSIPSPKESGLYGAHGNTFTCTVQGVGIQLGFAAQYLTAFLMIYFLTTLRYGWSTKHFAKKCGILGCVLSIGWPTIFAIIGLCLQSFTTSYSVCFLRFDKIVRVFNTGIPVLLTLIILILCCILITHHVWMTERKMSKWTIDSYLQKLPEEDGLNGKSKIRGKWINKGISCGKLQRTSISSVAKQATLYVLAYAISIVPGVVCNVINMFGTKKACVIINVTTYPMQGFWNFVVFILPRVSKMNELCPHYPLYKKVYYAAYCRRGYNDEIRMSRKKVINEDAARRRSKIIMTNISQEGSCALSNRQQGYDDTNNCVSVKSTQENHCALSDGEQNYDSTDDVCDGSSFTIRL